MLARLFIATRTRLTGGLVLLALALGAPLPAAAFETAARAAIVIDHRSGDVLFAKNPDERLPPASMSKLMTAYMVFARLEEGSLRLDDEFPVSEKAWRTGGSKMFVKVGDRVTVEDLLRGVIVQSGNDACVVVAEALAGSEEAFAERMTRRARDIGLADSTFKNATGLPDPEHLTTVRDLATLARTIIAEFPDYYGFYALTEFEYAGIHQKNRNPLLQAGVPGVDGLKTGHTSEAGYGLVASAERDGRRLILVVAGLESERQRRMEAERLLEYAFRDFREYRLFAADEAVVEAPVWMGANDRVGLVPAGPVAVTLSREARDDLVVKLLYDAPVAAPIAAGQQLGRLQLSAPGLETRDVPLVAAHDVPPAGLLKRVQDAVSHLVGGAS
ncbi:D-alanyl-D-alanine carboxypeptidase family protein [Marinimicrococcus flavescens]|uniref:serine-type D-Ala-D-Ala carboxypeptidase n=1 Tax=Marinimicrococcus flavescens TaxID=3031815 RepID=A0AAP3V2V4_9PROT|nr:D-alanyl-D-alanine carboxypeptidase [Marinimicrococcus flavescens]